MNKRQAKEWEALGKEGREFAEKVMALPPEQREKFARLMRAMPPERDEFTWKRLAKLRKSGADFDTILVEVERRPPAI